VAVTLVGSVGALVWTSQDKRDAKSATLLRLEEADRSLAAAHELARLRAQINQAMNASDSLHQSLENAARKKGVVQFKEGLNPADRQTLDDVTAAQTDTNRRLSALESALSNSPEKAIALPLLRQQITDLQEKNHGDLDNVHGEIGRLYTMMQWFLGLMITLIIGVGGLIVNNLKQRVERSVSLEGSKV
jgi:site-specific recombinase